MQTLDKHFRKLAGPVFQKHGFAQGDVLAHWAAIVGSDFALIAQPDRIRWPRGQDGAGGGVLHVKVAAGRVLDVQYAADTILAQVNQFLGFQAVTSLKTLQTAGNLRTKAKPAPPPLPDAATLQQVEAVSDPPLQEALARLGMALKTHKTRSPQAK
jgi:hypothetical protein